MLIAGITALALLCAARRCRSSGHTGIGTGAAERLQSAPRRPDQLYGEAGDDELLGLGGNDYIEAGPGNDEIDAGGGLDLVIGGHR